MDINLLREAVTVASFIVFLLIVVFAALPGNGPGFERASQLPPDEEGR